jgi:hypothetical protein
MSNGATKQRSLLYCGTRAETSKGWRAAEAADKIAVSICGVIGQADDRDEVYSLQFP